MSSRALCGRERDDLAVRVVDALLGVGVALEGDGGGLAESFAEARGETGGVVLELFGDGRLELAARRSVHDRQHDRVRLHQRTCRLDDGAARLRFALATRVTRGFRFQIPRCGRWRVQTRSTRGPVAFPIEHSRSSKAKHRLNHS